MIVIVDYGMGNIGSILNMLKKVGAAVTVSADPAIIAAANKLILPGVGAFDSAMHNLKKLDLIGILSEQVLVKKTPVLGICLGMQLFARGSEEGNEPGLGWLNAEIKKFNFSDSELKLKVPFMGWNVVKPLQSGTLFSDESEQRFYFVHSYHWVNNSQNLMLAKTNYGYDYAAAVQSNNIYGVQFHPEKSHRFGLQLLKSFVEHC